MRPHPLPLSLPHPAIPSHGTASPLPRRTHTYTLHSTQVRAVRLRKDRVAVALEHKVLVYDFEHLRLLHQFDTLSNKAGLLALSPSPDQTVLACLGLHAGQVRIKKKTTIPFFSILFGSVLPRMQPRGS